MRVGRESRFIVPVTHQPKQPSPFQGPKPFSPSSWSAHRMLIAAIACCLGVACQTCRDLSPKCAWKVASWIWNIPEFEASGSSSCRFGCAHVERDSAYITQVHVDQSARSWVRIGSYQGTREAPDGVAIPIVATSVIAANNLNAPLCSQDAAQNF